LRDKHTVNPFPELNYEALAYTIDVIAKKAKGESTSLAENNPELEKLIQGENFGKIYGYFIDKSTPSETNDELLKTTKGRWVKYEKGSDPKTLAESLRGHFTGWCIASEPTAKTYLTNSDFWIYSSHDKNGEPSKPRAGIEIKEGEIAAIHGIAKGQNLDPYIADVLEKKLEEFPDKEKYKKKTADMKLLTEIDNKQKKGEKLTLNELKFLYEIDSKIEGFGLQNDPRIEEIKKQRDNRKDLADIFNCRPKQVALNINELNKTTIVFWGNLICESQIRELPPKLTHIVGALHLAGNTHITELPATLTHIYRYLDIDKSKIKKLPTNLLHIGGNLIISSKNQSQELPTNISDIVKGKIIKVMRHNNE
jgi:hypothetical protein